MSNPSNRDLALELLDSMRDNSMITTTYITPSGTKWIAYREDLDCLLGDLGAGTPGAHAAWCARFTNEVISNPTRTVADVLRAIARTIVVEVKP